MTLYIVDIEKLDTRYTAEWAVHLPEQLRNSGISDVVVVSGPDDIPSIPTPGMFLNFSATNVYKSVQIEKISRLFCDGVVKDGDYFLFTDAWHPGVINLKYMIELLGVKAKVGGLWHAGSYDPADGLGRTIGDAAWVRNAEKSMIACYDDNFFATRFHVNLIAQIMELKYLFEEDYAEVLMNMDPSIKIVGWPMEYLKAKLAGLHSTAKKNKIIFPHRIAPEKQLPIFRALAERMPEYEWFVAQDQVLTKAQYHQHLAESKIVFSANLQETLGISTYEGMLVGCVPMVPDRLSYTEMYPDDYKYASDASLDDLEARVREIMNRPIPNTLGKDTDHIGDTFFNGSAMYDAIKLRHPV